MAVQTVEIHARPHQVRLPVLWRLSRLFNVVPHLRRARVTEDFGYMLLDLEGAAPEVGQASQYLCAMGLMGGQNEPVPVAAPEDEVDRTNSIALRLTAVDAQQARTPVLHRIGKDFNTVYVIDRAAFDEEEGGWLEITLSGPLIDVQRAIAYLHTTGLQVFPFQRSVTDFNNL